MATAYKNKGDPFGEIRNEGCIKFSEKENLKPFISKPISSERNLCSKENVDESTVSQGSLTSRMKEKLVKRTKSDKITTAEKKKSKVKSFSSLFSRRKPSINVFQETPKESNVESKGTGEKLLPVKKYTQLDESVEGPDSEKTKLGDTIFALTKKICELEEQLEDKKLEASITRTGSQEYDFLRRKIETLGDEIERLEMQNAFLDEEKTDVDKKFKEAIQSYENLRSIYETTDAQRKSYRKKLIEAKRAAQDTLSQLTEEMNQINEENRYLLKKGLSGKPKDFEKFMKITDEYMKLLSDRNRIHEECEEYITRMVHLELKTDDLKLDLASAVTALDQAGIEWHPISEGERMQDCSDQDYESQRAECTGAERNEELSEVQSTACTKSKKTTVL